MSAAAGIAGAALGRAAAIGRRHPLALAALALVTGGPPGLLLATSWIDERLGLWYPEPDFPFDVARLLVLPVWALLLVVQAGAATSGALRAARGEPFRLGAALAAGLRRAPAVLAIGAVTGAATLAGAAALVLPGAIALAALSAAAPALLDERMGPLRALRRSAELTRGHRAGVLAAAVAATAAAALAGWGPIAWAAARMDYGRAPPAAVFAIFAWLSLTAQLPAVMAAAAYVELRARKEAPAAPELERVFG